MVRLKQGIRTLYGFYQEGGVSVCTPGEDDTPLLIRTVLHTDGDMDTWVADTGTSPHVVAGHFEQVTAVVARLQRTRQVMKFLMNLLRGTGCLLLVMTIWDGSHENVRMALLELGCGLPALFIRRIVLYGVRLFFRCKAGQIFE